MEKETIEYNANGQPRKRRKDGGYIYRSGRPVTNPGKLISLRINIDLLAWLNDQGNKTDYINSLIRKDMEQRNNH